MEPVLILAAKLVVAPTLIGAVSLAGRRWGPEVSGWLAGLPITGGPILWFIAVEHGTAFAAATALAALGGLIAFVAFCAAFAWSGRRVAWWLALPLGYAAYFLAGWPVTRWHPPVALATVTGALALIAGAWALPRTTAKPSGATRPWWELPARMTATAIVVLMVTGLAGWLGPGWSGVLSVFPTAATVLGGFALRHDGPEAAARVLRGLHLGMIGLTAFLAVLALLPADGGLGAGFALGTAACVAVQAATLVALRLARRQAVPPAEPRHSQASSSSSTV